MSGKNKLYVILILFLLINLFFLNYTFATDTNEIDINQFNNIEREPIPIYEKILNVYASKFITNIVFFVNVIFFIVINRKIAINDKLDVTIIVISILGFIASYIVYLSIPNRRSYIN